MLRGHERMVRQFLQHLGHKRRRDAVLLGNLVGAASMLLAMHGQVLDGNQPVISFFGKLEHRLRDFLDAPQYATERSEEHTSELQSQSNLVCRLLLEKKKSITC